MNTSTKTRAMTVRGAALLGVGSMVGAGILALPGGGGAAAGAVGWPSLLIAGVIATLQWYAVAKLGDAIRSRVRARLAARDRPVAAA